MTNMIGPSGIKVVNVLVWIFLPKICINVKMYYYDECFCRYIDEKLLTIFLRHKHNSGMLTCKLY